MPGGPGGTQPWPVKYLNGKQYRMYIPSEKAEYERLTRSGGTGVVVGVGAGVTVGQKFAAEASFDLKSYLTDQGIDVEAPEVAAFVETFRLQMNDPATRDKFTKLLQFVAPASQTDYQAALEMSGFGSDPYPVPFGAPASRGVAGETKPVSAPAPAARFEEAEGTGWTRFENGVLVSPEGQVVFDPTSKAPGSLAWKRDVVSKWGEDKIKEQRQMLIQMGYLPKGSGKSGVVDVTFLAALGAYHENRYVNGGKAVPQEAGGAGSGATVPKAVDLEDFSSQIRNDVREQYERVFGVRPTAGEVELWKDYIIRNGMAMQQKFRKKYDAPQTSLALTEAGESFIEKIEGSPKAEFLRESEEENTRLRDTFDRMAQVTNSLTS